MPSFLAGSQHPHLQPHPLDHPVLRAPDVWGAAQEEHAQLLQDKDQYDWLLKERTDTRDKRKFLKERLERLSRARQRLAKFPG